MLVEPLPAYLHAAMLSQALARFGLIPCLIEPLSDDAAIIQTLPAMIPIIAASLYGCGGILCLPLAREAAATSMCSTSASIRDCGLLSSWLSLLRRVSTSHAVLSPPDVATPTKMMSSQG